jgi:tRNA nucleotidyltransferase (CCA-adding enzyme)
LINTSKYVYIESVQNGSTDNSERHTVRNRDNSVTHNPKENTKDLTIITTHVNADFDAMASMLAAQKLYPDAKVVFPGSQDKNLRNFFITSMVYLYNILDIRDIDFDRVNQLVLVDTRQANRIGKFSELLKNPDVSVHIYDHHPPMQNDIEGDLTVIDRTGANVTLLLEIIRGKKIEISADEATMLCLGIYEDTGSFTFSSTTPRDLRAAAYLLSQGANLNTVSDLIAREISGAQVGVLNDLVQAAMHHNVNGVDVVVTKMTSDIYIPDFAFLVHKMINMENLNAIFALGQMENKIYLVGRSRVPEVDAGVILTAFGGGGHEYAAAAAVKEQTLVQTEARLLALLNEKVKSRRLAKHLMSSPAITVDVHVPCQVASDMLNHYNVNALVVVQEDVEGSSLVGYITRQIIEKALYHKLAHLPVGEYMTTDIASVAPDANLEEIQEKIIENKQRILPVMDLERIAGVITRNDLLDSLVRRSQDLYHNSNLPAAIRKHPRTRSIINFMRERLAPRLLDILREIGKAAEHGGCEAYVVGGFVRDLFLYRKNEDVDIVIEGDGIKFAKSFARRYGARIHAHAKFGTAVIIFPDGFKIDVASARMEYYKFPAAMPVVEMSSIKLDLFRRDFTINTLSIRLNPREFGTLQDFFSAQKDIKEKAIRVLHNMSFVEDPTRVFRAIRFEQRFGFGIGKLTLGLIRNAVKMDFFKRLSGYRVFTELRLILEEENPTFSLRRMNDFKLLGVIHPSIRLTDELIDLFNSTKKVVAWHDLLFLEESYMKWAVYFLALVRRTSRKTVAEICHRLELPPKYEIIFCKEKFIADRCLYGLEQKTPVKNSTLYNRLKGFRTELILYLMAVTKSERVKRVISNYFNRLRYVEISIRGRDLMDMQVPPGPLYREILEAVLDAKLDGRVKTKNDELLFAKAYIKKKSK